MTAPEPTPTAEHTDAVARVICDAEGFVWPDTEHARDVWRVKAHSAMLDALVRAGVLVRTTITANNATVSILAERIEVAP